MPFLSMHKQIVNFNFLSIMKIYAICPMHDTTEGRGINNVAGTTAFKNVEGTNQTGIHPSNQEVVAIQPPSIQKSYGLVSNPVGFNNINELVANHDGYTGFRQHYLPGFHSLDYDLFGKGTLNHSYSKTTEGSFYGRTDEEPFVNSLISSSNLDGNDGAGGGLVVGSIPENGAGVKPDSQTEPTSKGTVGQSSPSGASGKSFKFNQNSPEAVLSDYTKFFNASKLFAFNPTLDAPYKIVLVSTTKEYHPQMKIVEINKSGGEKYVEKFGEDKGNGMYSTVYGLRKDREYLIEIGASEKLDFKPFSNINTGGFICVISAEKGSLQALLARQDYKVAIFGKTGNVPLGQSEVLELAGADWKKEGSGMLNYSVTPFYNQEAGSVTIFFHNESTFSEPLASTAKEAAVVEFICKLDATSNPVHEGEEASKKIIEFKIPCRSVCDLVDLLK